MVAHSLSSREPAVNGADLGQRGVEVTQRCPIGAAYLHTVACEKALLGVFRYLQWACGRYCGRLWLVCLFKQLQPVRAGRRSLARCRPTTAQPSANAAPTSGAQRDAGATRRSRRTSGTRCAAGPVRGGRRTNQPPRQYPPVEVRSIV